MQAELAAELEGEKGSLEVLDGRWWRKRWSRQKAEAAMNHLLRLLEVSASLLAHTQGQCELPCLHLWLLACDMTSTRSPPQQPLIY